jgi:hypothetical protein
MADISSVLLTTLTGMMGVVIGAIISNYFNQKIARQAAKKDTIFKKKIEYFENIVQTIGKNIEIYNKIIKKIEKENSPKKINEAIKYLKEKRKKFEIMTSPLYLDITPISNEIKKFVSLEKNIFANLEKINKDNSKKDLIYAIRLDFIEIRRIGTSIVIILREDLIK